MESSGSGPSPELMKTRALSSRPFIGHSRPDVPQQRLASVQDMLNIISWNREQPKCQKKPVKQMCCSVNKEREARCLLPGGCLEKSEPCLLLKVKRKYLQAGIVTVSDRRIVERLEAEQEKYQGIFRHRDRKNPADIVAREGYLTHIKQTFDIKDHNARQVIENDPVRSEEARGEDLAFFDDFFGERATRTWQLGERDRGYDEDHYNSFMTATEVTNLKESRANKRAEKEQALEERREKEQREIEESHRMVELPAASDEEEVQVNENDNDETYVGPSSRKRIRSQGQKGARARRQGGQEDDDDQEQRRMSRSRRREDREGSGGGGGEEGEDSDEEEDGVWALIPKEIIKKTSATAIRHELSHGDHVNITAAFLRSCTGEDGAPLDLDQFPLSYSTSYRRRKEVMETTYEETRAEFRNNVIAGNIPLLLHGDDKELSDTIGPHGAGVKNKVERQVVILTSPMLEEDQFVSAHAIEDGTGRAQAEGAVNSVRDLGVLDLVVGSAGDTTGSVTSLNVGMMALIEEVRGVMLLRMPCRRHHWDLFGKNIRRRLSIRGTTGPKYYLFSRLDRDEYKAFLDIQGESFFDNFGDREWPELVGVIDYNNLAVFDMNRWRGTFVEQLVVELRVWARQAYLTGVFPRGSYYDFLNCIIKYLGAAPPNFTFKFTKPKDVTNARFLEPAEYYVKFGLLAPQLPWLTPEERREVADMAFISAVLYGPGFLKSPLGLSAAFNDLSSIKSFRLLRPYMPEAAAEGLATWERHLDYLTPPHIVTALCDDNWSEEQRKGLARALLELLPQRQLILPPGRVSYPGPHFCTNDVFWPADGSLPVLAQFATLHSFLIPNILEIPTESLQDWFQSPVLQWSDNPRSPFYKEAFHQIKMWAQKAEYTNDCCERGVNNLKNLRLNFHKESNLQESLAVQYEERKKLKAGKNGQIRKSKLNNM